MGVFHALWAAAVEPIKQTNNKIYTLFEIKLKKKNRKNVSPCMYFYKRLLMTM